MDPRNFDALTRRAAGALTRRSLVTAVAGAALAATVPALGVVAKKGGKKRKKRCRPEAVACVAAVAEVCADFFPTDQALRDLCHLEHLSCCEFYLKCQKVNGERCLEDLPTEPLCCPNEDDVCCWLIGSPVACCPASFPVCPRSGDPAICCPASAPIACANGSCTREGFTCCPNNSGSCPTGQVCCDNDRCCPAGTTCVGTNQCV